MAQIRIGHGIIAAHWIVLVRARQFFAHGIFGRTVLETDHCDKFISCQGKAGMKLVMSEFCNVI